MGSNDIITLGFVEKCDSWKLHSCFFPSKAGGKPSWLALESLPSAEELQCDVCKEPTVFLLQVYAPFEEKEDAFHRTLYLFICKNEECSKQDDSKNIKVFRCQLPRNNKFYSSTPPEEDPKQCFDIEKFTKLCFICGCSGTKHCAKCKNVYYCSREHQIVDWRNGHKKICGSGNDSGINSSEYVLYPEFEIIQEEEEESCNESTDDKDDEEKHIAEYERLVLEGKTGTMENVSEEDLQPYAETNIDKTFKKFKKRIAQYPDQILRYQKNGKPIWVSENPIPEQIPNCEYCNGERQFEFQVLPQLLYNLKEYKIDFGTLVIYTCKNSCSDNVLYKNEYVFKQNIKGLV